MKYASDFRQTAWDALRGRWGVAVIAGLLASLLGVNLGGNGPELNFQYSDNGAAVNLEFANQTIYSSSQGMTPQLQGFLTGAAVYIGIAAVIFAVAYFILGSVIHLGYSKFNLDVIDRTREPQIGTMFGYFGFWQNATVANLLQTLYVILWSLLFVIPGIIATYSYAMTGFILAEHPDMAPSDAIAWSKDLMHGNRWRLFCLNFSFIGWDLLSLVTLGIADLWVSPYKAAARAAFYREISGTAGTPRIVDGEVA